MSLRVAVIGVGHLGRHHARILASLPGVELVAVADTRPEAAKALAQGFNCPSYESYKAMVDAEKFDAVIVCTPPSTHLEISTFFLSRGINVLCEKPLSIDSASSQQMLDVAAKSGAILTMGSKFRYVEDVIRAKSIVASGILGEIVLFENAFTARVDMSNRWNSNPKISGGGVLIDNGAHSVDIMRYFLGPIADVQAVEGKRVAGLAVEDTVRVFIRSTAGVMGNVDLSWSINKELDSYINIYGSNGTISVGWKESKYRQSASREWVTFGKGYNKVQAFRSQLTNFAKNIRDEEPLVINAEDALASVQVIEAAYASLKQHNWVAVNGHKTPVKAA